MNDDPINKTNLLARIEHGWRELQETIAGLDDAALSRPDPATGWAIKDHLFHLAAWEGGIAALLRRESRAAGMGLTENEWEGLTMDEVNALIYERNRHRPAAEARVVLQSVHDGMLAAIDELSDDDLLRGYAHYEPGAPEGDAPVIGWIVGDTFGHYEEHVGYFRSLLAG